MLPVSEIRSIFAYVENKCYDGLYDAAARYIARNWNNMDLESPRVPDIHTAELADAWVRRVYVSDLPGDYISFDVGMELQVANDHQVPIVGFYPTGVEPKRMILKLPMLKQTFEYRNEFTALQWVNCFMLDYASSK